MMTKLLVFVSTFLRAGGLQLAHRRVLARKLACSSAVFALRFPAGVSTWKQLPVPWERRFLTHVSKTWEDDESCDNPLVSLETEERNMLGAVSKDEKSEHGKSEASNETSAVHQVEHRAKEKGAMALSQRLTESLVTKMEVSAARSGERAIERAAEKIGERAGERAFDRLAEEAIERTSERLAERMGERVAEQAAERAVERAGGKIAGRAGERAAEHVGERLAERIGEHSGERIAERLSQGALERTGERLIERAGERASGHTLAKSFERIFGISSKRIALRLGRGLLIALPALGGIFALYLLRSDLRRLQEERRKRNTGSSLLFAGAGLADGLDSILHFWIAFGLLSQLSHHDIILAEQLSVWCAVMSTLGAVLGEVVSQRIQKRRKRNLPEDG